MSKHKRKRWGRGSVVQVGGRWRAIVSDGFDPLTKKRRRPDAYAATEAEAERELERLLREIADREGSARRQVADPTVAEYLTTWMDRQSGRQTTKCIRADKLAPVITHLGHVRLRALESDRLRTLLNTTLLTQIQLTTKAPYAPRTRERMRDVLRAALNDAMTDKAIKLEENAALGIAIKGLEDQFDPRVLTYAEKASFLSAARKLEVKYAARAVEAGELMVSMELFWRIKLELGPRAGELLGLRWSNVDLAERRMYIKEQLQRVRGKGSRKNQPRGRGENLELVPLKTKSSRRPLELSADLLAAVRAHSRRLLRLAAKYGASWNPMDLVFPTATGHPMQHSALTHTYFRPTCRIAGIQYRDRKHKDGFNIHGCRHTAATHMLRRETNIVMVQLRLGHSSLAMTQRYLHLLTPEERRKVA
jgi:integrase